MTADVELLPLPEWTKRDDAGQNVVPSEIRVSMADYARANVAHTTAARGAEIEALRVEIGRWRALADTGTAESFLALSDDDKRKWFAMALRESSERKQAEARAERLAEAGRRVTAAFRALGDSSCITAAAIKRRECEAAMLAFDALLRDQK